MASVTLYLVRVLQQSWTVLTDSAHKSIRPHVTASSAPFPPLGGEAFPRPPLGALSGKLSCLVCLQEACLSHKSTRMLSPLLLLSSKSVRSQRPCPPGLTRGVTPCGTGDGGPAPTPPPGSPQAPQRQPPVGSDHCRNT